MALSWVEIDLEALRRNFFQARDRVFPGAHLLGVIKSDAYGHGMVSVARELAACGIDFLGVSKYWEAEVLLTGGINIPIIVLLGFEVPDMEEGVRRGVRTVAFRLDHLKLLSRAACVVGKSAKVHLKIDTGMGRLGVPCDKAASFLEEAFTLPGIEIEGVLSHFASADEPDKSYCACQVGRFRQVLQIMADSGHPIAYAHMANSAALLELPHSHFHLARPGIMLYGSMPSCASCSPLDLMPVMSLKSRILQLKEVPAGCTIGYGRTFITQKPSLIATVPVGYDDGYPRALSNQGRVLVGGKRAAVVGRVSMNLITIDVTDIPQSREDDEVVLLGSQGQERITADEIAGLCETISYEVYCSIGKNRNKLFLNASLIEGRK